MRTGACAMSANLSSLRRGRSQSQAGEGNGRRRGRFCRKQLLSALEVFRRPDIDECAGDGVSLNRQAAIDQSWKHIFPEIGWDVAHEMQDFRIPHVDAGVGPARENLICRRLLDEAPDAPITV